MSPIDAAYFGFMHGLIVGACATIFVVACICAALEIMKKGKR